MSNLHIRPARPGDLGSLTRRLGQERFFADRLDRQADGRGVLLTAWCADVVVGVVHLWMEQAEEREIREHLPGVPLITHLEIHPDCRRTGVGTTLVQVAEKLLTAQGYDRIALAVGVGSADAGQLYARLGYRVWPHPPIRCCSVGDGHGHRQVEICNVLTKALAR
ncbi:hypothetical protein UK23_27120 [Lentzea aerocolonigenes]|uniref:N-acetyltransferase domain-containing protein n=1 Tax=Lentzea aerocolonigenes TaxID=68170 RepID=A0A0F0GUL4_LENAE|nr:GNAT family N-acetyltransferase [Lentzea aerocolonigenes]KJK45098.1 hypothetical protein UK23_27120 [Lentzea aerocolonigenes]